MKNIINFWKNNEQIITFLSLIIYLNGFAMYFYDEMQKGGWITGLWLFQFFFLTTCFGLRSVRKGWKLPKDIKDTHSW